MVRRTEPRAKHNNLLYFFIGREKKEPRGEEPMCKISYAQLPSFDTDF